jgi:hypothetical protein
MRARKLGQDDDGFVWETFCQPRDDARATARAFLDRYPKAAYMSDVESWRELPDGEIEFTMRRLRTADSPLAAARSSCTALAAFGVIWH